MTTLIGAGNSFILGIWSDGITMWVADVNPIGAGRGDRLDAYNSATKADDNSKDFNTLDAAENIDPFGFWSDGATMWVTDYVDDKLYAYDFSFIDAVTAQSSNQIALSWDAIANASIYRVYRSTEVAMALIRNYPQ